MSSCQNEYQGKKGEDQEVQKITGEELTNDLPCHVPIKDPEYDRRNKEGKNSYPPYPQ